jgi:hypothetical protein
MAGSKTLQTDGELDVTRADNVLNLKVGELGVEAELLDDTSVLARGQLRVVFGLCTSDDHLARGKDEGRGLGLADTHDDSSETLEAEAFSTYPTALHKPMKHYLGVVLCVTCVQGNSLEIESAVKVHRGDNVPFQARNVNNMPTTERCKTWRYSLQCGDNATDTLTGARRSSWSRGSHPCTLLGRDSSLCRLVLALRLRSVAVPVCAVCLRDVLSVFFRRRWGEIARATWERQRAGCGEVLGLSGGRGMSDDSLHDCGVSER